MSEQDLLLDLLRETVDEVLRADKPDPVKTVAAVHLFGMLDESITRDARIPRAWVAKRDERDERVAQEQLLRRVFGVPC